FRAHARIELVAVLLDRLEVHLVGEQLAALQRGHARVDDHNASKYSTRSISRSVMSSMRPMREGSDFRNQMCAVGLASSMCPMRSRRTLDCVTSTPHFSQTTPRCLRRLYLPQRHS